MMLKMNCLQTCQTQQEQQTKLTYCLMGSSCEQALRCVNGSGATHIFMAFAETSFKQFGPQVMTVKSIRTSEVTHVPTQ
jgi:hypothetical protein